MIVVGGTAGFGVGRVELFENQPLSMSLALRVYFFNTAFLSATAFNPQRERERERERFERYIDPLQVEISKTGSQSRRHNTMTIDYHAT